MSSSSSTSSTCNKEEPISVTTGPPSDNVPPSSEPPSGFILKLFQMVNGAPDEVISWTPEGDAFIIGSDVQRLERETLPHYFRHNRFPSLVRQLNFYSFRKINRERNVWVYQHALFQRNCPENLHKVRRRTCPGVDGRKQRFASGNVNKTKTPDTTTDIGGAISSTNGLVRKVSLQPTNKTSSVSNTTNDGTYAITTSSTTTTSVVESDNESSTRGNASSNSSTSSTSSDDELGFVASKKNDKSKKICKLSLQNILAPTKLNRKRPAGAVNSSSTSSGGNKRRMLLHRSLPKSSKSLKTADSKNGSDENAVTSTPTLLPGTLVSSFEVGSQQKDSKNLVIDTSMMVNDHEEEHIVMNAADHAKYQSQIVSQVAWQLDSLARKAGRPRIVTPPKHVNVLTYDDDHDVSCAMYEVNSNSLGTKIPSDSPDRPAHSLDRALSKSNTHQLMATTSVPTASSMVSADMPLSGTKVTNSILTSRGGAPLVDRTTANAIVQLLIEYRNDNPSSDTIMRIAPVVVDLLLSNSPMTLLHKSHNTFMSSTMVLSQFWVTNPEVAEEWQQYREALYPTIHNHYNRKSTNQCCQQECHDFLTFCVNCLHQVLLAAPRLDEEMVASATKRGPQLSRPFVAVLEFVACAWQASLRC